LRKLLLLVHDFRVNHAFVFFGFGLRFAFRLRAGLAIAVLYTAGLPALVRSGFAMGSAAAMVAAIVLAVVLLGRGPAFLLLAVTAMVMGGLGADEAAVRSSISRLKQRGILEPARHGSAAGYGLSQRGTEILAEGDRRIFERPRARLASVDRIGTMSGMSRQSSRPATGGVPSWSIEIVSPSSENRIGTPTPTSSSSTERSG